MSLQLLDIIFHFLEELKKNVFAIFVETAS